MNGGAAVDLSVSLAGMRLDNPVMTAAGCTGSGREISRYVDLTGLGGVVTRSVTRDRVEGPGRRIVETPSGLLFSAAAAGPGVDHFLATELPWLLQTEARVLVSVRGHSLEEYAELARRVGDTPGIAALEVVLDAPPRGDAPSHDPVAMAGRIVGVVRREAARGVPVLVKLTPGHAPLPALAVAVADSGADAVVVAGTPPGTSYDPHTLGAAVRGHLVGPAVLPLTLHAVTEVVTALPDMTIVAAGGVCSGRDAAALLAAGASAVQIGTALLREPAAAARIVAELGAELAARGAPRAADLIGTGRAKTA